VSVPAERGRLAATVSATGTLNPVKTVEVGTYVSGRIESIDIDFNSVVHRGQVIARIDPATYRVRVKQAEANLANARAGLERGEANLKLRRDQLERQRALLQKNVISDDAFEAAQNLYDQARAELGIDRAGLQVAEAGLEDARVSLGYTDIVSPVDGVVLSRNVNVGQTVAASFQTPTLFLIADDLTRMQVNASVSESDIGSVREGQPASFKVDAYASRVFEGRVRQVRNSPSSVQNVVTYDVVVEVQNSDLALRPGMTATVTLHTAERDDVLKVPLRALRFRPRDRVAGADVAAAAPVSGRARLWIDVGSAAPRPVEIELGMANDEEVEVASAPIAAGDAIIVGYASAR
jgi:HlyD family secretion protein